MIDSSNYYEHLSLTGYHIKKDNSYHEEEKRLIPCPKCKGKAHIKKDIDGVFRVGCNSLDCIDCGMRVYDFDLQDAMNRWNNLPENLKAAGRMKAFICIVFSFLFLVCIIYTFPHNDNFERKNMNPYDYKAFNTKQQTWYIEGFNNKEEYKEHYKEQYEKETRQIHLEKKLGLWIDPETDVIYFKDFWGRKTPRYNADGSIMKKDDWMENHEK